MQIARKRWESSEKVALESFGRRMRGPRNWEGQGLNLLPRDTRSHGLRDITDNCNWVGQIPKGEDGRKRYLFR